MNVLKAINTTDRFFRINVVDLRSGKTIAQTRGNEPEKIPVSLQGMKVIYTYADACASIPFVDLWINAERKSLEY